MRKKIILALIATGTGLAMLPLLAAFEAHVVNVTATIENALSVVTESIQYGTVFPQEELDEQLEVTLSQSFGDQDRLDDVEYVIRQKPKCGLPIPQTAPVQYEDFAQVIGEDADGNFICPGNADTDTDEEGPDEDTDGPSYVQLPVLCPYLSKHEDTEDGQETENDTGLDAFHGKIPWTLQDTLAYQAFGRLAQSAPDLVDSWIIDLRVPCFEGSCAQDWPTFVETESGSTTINAADYEADPADEHELFGCDLWLEVTGFSPFRIE